MCIFILHLFIISYVTFFLFYFICFLKNFFSHCSGEFRHPRVSCSTAQPLFGSTDEDLSRTKEELLGTKARIALHAKAIPSSEINAEKQYGQGFFYLLCSLSLSESPEPHSVLQI